MVIKKKNNKKDSKTGKEIIELYKEMKTAGMTPEEVMLFLVGYMQQTKSTKIGMDISNDCGKKFCITVEMNEGGTDEQPEGNHPKIFKAKIPPGVT